MSENDGGKVAIVTGGSRGIGRAVVEALLGEGWRVFFCSRRPESVERAVSQLVERFGDQGDRGHRVVGEPVDVGRQEEVDGFVERVAAAAGRIDCLVNNAGRGAFGPVDELSGDTWREVVATNLSGAFYFTRAVAPAMKRQGSGWIFNVASLAGKNPFAGGALYNATKFGLVGFSEASMLDLRPHGIRVAAILPGSVDTGFEGRSDRSDRSWMLAPEDVASMIVHLLGYPERALPSLIEMRPSRPPKK